MGKRRKQRQKLRKIKKQAFPLEEIIERNNRPSDRTIPSRDRLPITLDRTSRNFLFFNKSEKGLLAWIRLVESFKASLCGQRDPRNAPQTRNRDEDYLQSDLFREGHFPRPITIKMMSR